MKTRGLGVLLALAALSILVATAAAGGNATRASLDSGLVGVIGDPATISARCPAGESWLAVVQFAGSGTLTSASYTGAVTAVSEHCTRLLLDRPGHSIGKVAAGVQTFTTPVGAFQVRYQGTFVLEGAFPADYETNATMAYEVTGGTGVFAGATGSGHMDVVDTPGGSRLELNGSLKSAS